MKKTIALFIVIATAALLFAGFAQPAAEKKGDADIDIAILGKTWQEIDLGADATAYKHAYMTSDPGEATVFLTFVKHYEKREADLAADLEKNVVNYTEQTLPVSMKEVNISDIEYIEIDGFPAARFTVVGNMGGAGDFKALTTFLATEKGIYCLQTQSLFDIYPQFESIFDELQESLRVS